MPDTPNASTRHPSITAAAKIGHGLHDRKSLIEGGRSVGELRVRHDRHEAGRHEGRKAKAGGLVNHGLQSTSARLMIGLIFPVGVDQDIHVEELQGV